MARKRKTKCNCALHSDNGKSHSSRCSKSKKRGIEPATMEEGEEMDDAHVCLKCHTTILGLDNYVRHRRDQCGTRKRTPKEEPAKPDPSQDRVVINADDFFAFLELQSSTKKTEPLARAMKQFGVLTRSKASEVMKVSNAREMIHSSEKCDTVMQSHEIHKEKSSIEFKAVGQSHASCESEGLHKKYDQDMSLSIDFHAIDNIGRSSSVRESEHHKDRQESTESIDLQNGEPAGIPNGMRLQNGTLERSTQIGFRTIENISQSSNVKENEQHKDNGEHAGSIDFHAIDDIGKSSYDSESLHHKDDQEITASGQFKTLNILGQFTNREESLQKKSHLQTESAIDFNIIDNIGRSSRAHESLLKKKDDAEENNVCQTIKSILGPSPWGNGNDSLHKANDPVNTFHGPSELEFDDDLNEEYDDFALSVTDSEDDNDHNPPTTHTGGKWNPGGLQGSPTSWSRSTPLTLDEDHDGAWRLALEDCTRTTPPPNHIDGEWKPQTPTDTAAPNPLPQRDSSESNRGHTDDEDVPPPGHTSGKWVPGRAQSSEDRDETSLTHPHRKFGNTVQYWCGPCNRRLSSNKLYQKHLQSELHLRKTLPERQLDEDTMPLVKPKAEKESIIEHSRGEGKRVIKPTEIYRNSELFKGYKRKQDVVSEKVLEEPSKMKRRTVRCSVCRAIVWSHLMGKHLISRFHSRKSIPGDPINQALVLENIQSVVQQSPFQCSPCKFYCNTMASFNRHWRSKQHVQTDIKLNGRYWCSFCKYWCETSSEMGEHLNSADHKEVITIINYSVPIVIFKRSTVSCWTCNQEFRYNIELKKHCLKTRHLDFQTVQEQYCCSMCTYQAHTRRALHFHTLKNHKDVSEDGEQIGAYFCTTCGVTFPTYQEAEVHRRSQEHKYKSLEDRKSRGLIEQDLTKICQHCDSSFENILELKSHLHNAHPDCKLRCPHCGMAFVLKQEVSRHVRDKACVFSTATSPPEEEEVPVKSIKKEPEQVPVEEPPQVEETRPPTPVPEDSASTEVEEPVVTPNSKPELIDIHPNVITISTLRPKCSQCPYTCESKAEMLFHETLHGTPLSGEELRTNGGLTCVVSKYTCPLCMRPFRKGALLSHLHTHTNERPFICGICGRGFGYRSSMVVHIKKSHPKHNPVQATESTEVIRMFCIEDRCKFTTKSCARMENHRAAHAANRSFLCAVCGSNFRLKQNLHQHMKLHTGKEFKCMTEGCIYACRSMAELRAHSHVHSEDRPFHCVTCSYRSKTRAQLARHELIHQGTKDHKCPHCPFRSRVSSHLRRHLRLHTGAKPYRCPYCSYTCNNLENLRKHVLSTNKHNGKMMYECKFCKRDLGDSSSAPVFATNLATTFKRHLVTTHPSSFQSPMLASSYVAGIYDAMDDPKHVENPIQLPPKKERYRPNVITHQTDGDENNLYRNKVRFAMQAEGEIHISDARPLMFQAATQSMFEELNVSIITNNNVQQGPNAQQTSMDNYIIIQCNNEDGNGVTTAEELEVIRLANQNGYFTFDRREIDDEGMNDVIRFASQDSIMFPLDHQEEVAIYSSDDGGGGEICVVEQQTESF